MENLHQKAVTNCCQHLCLDLRPYRHPNQCSQQRPFWAGKRSSDQQLLQQSRTVCAGTSSWLWHAVTVGATGAAHRVGTGYPRVRGGLGDSAPICQGGGKMSPGHAHGKPGVERQMAGIRQAAGSLWAAFAMQTRSCMKSCRIWPRKLGEKLCFTYVLSCSDIFSPPFYFLLTSVAFSQKKRFPARTFFSMVRNKILLALKLASLVCQQQSSLQQAG